MRHNAIRIVNLRMERIRLERGMGKSVVTGTKNKKEAKHKILLIDSKIIVRADKSSMPLVLLSKRVRINQF